MQANDSAVATQAAPAEDVAPEALAVTAEQHPETTPAEAGAPDVSHPVAADAAQADAPTAAAAVNPTSDLDSELTNPADPADQAQPEHSSPAPALLDPTGMPATNGVAGDQLVKHEHLKLEYDHTHEAMHYAMPPEMAHHAQYALQHDPTHALHHDPSQVLHHELQHQYHAAHEMHEAQYVSDDYGSPEKQGRKRMPTAAATAAGEQAQAEALARAKPKRKKLHDDGTVSRTTHGGVKIGGRAVTWVGGAGMSREVLDKMGIPQLRALFLKTFLHPTGSNNAEWLRKKLSQPPDPNVGAARAAVPRARDVTAEIWTTGTQFKGFTKQERFKLQQMGGNCEAKVVQVVDPDGDLVHTHDMPVPSKGKKKGKSSELQTMQIIGQEKFEMPPPKRARGGPSVDVTNATLKAHMEAADPRALGVVNGGGYDPQDAAAHAAGLIGEPSMMQTQWRNLEYEERHLLQAGMNVKVYRADENWHHGSLHKVSYVGPEDDLRMCVTIYYWEHDQSETRDIAEFFRGDANSLIQWQAPVTDMSAYPATQNMPLDDPMKAAAIAGP